MPCRQSIAAEATPTMNFVRNGEESAHQRIYPEPIPPHPVAPSRPLSVRFEPPHPPSALSLSKAPSVTKPAHPICTKAHSEKPAQHMQTEEPLRQAQGERRVKCVRVTGNARTSLRDGDLLWDFSRDALP
jgi:hypothetical protein